MTLSIWRYSHYILAISSSVFIILASITGFILSFEPINEQLQPHALSTKGKQLSISQTISNLNKTYDEIISLTVEKQTYLKANIVSKNGKTESIYVDPVSGKKLELNNSNSPIFKFCRSLHRSLFLKTTGRIIIGIVSLLMTLICITGLLLFIKRQGGIKGLFSKLVYDNFYQFFHVFLSRYFIIPILIISISGLYLSLKTLSILPKHNTQHNVEFESLKTTPKLSITDFDVFKKYTLNDLKQLDFPFAPDVEEFFLVQLNTEEYAINQFTGEVLSNIKLSTSDLLTYYSFILHTGQGTIIWASILALSSITIIFFLISGLNISSKRVSRIKNKHSASKAEIIILYGSENGSTLKFAKGLYLALIKQKHKAFICDLNSISKFESAKELLILTATYGEGAPPTNANKSLEKINKLNFKSQIKYSVLGFGSKSYKQFCQFAIDINLALSKQEKLSELTPIHTIHNRSFDAFIKWLNTYNTLTNKTININKGDIKLPKLKTTSLTVDNITPKNERVNDTFLIAFKTKKPFESGDLLAICPPNDNRERFYSIGKTNTNTATLSVKKHEVGIVSNLLYNLTIGEQLECALVKNYHFHLPKTKAPILCIANGTGIGPFLGFLKSIKSKKSYLIWGGQTQQDFKLYENTLNKVNVKPYPTKIYTAYSREKTTKTYVQHIIAKHPEIITNVLNESGYIFICGSLQMLNDVSETISEITTPKLGQSFEFYKKSGQILTDCY